MNILKSLGPFRGIRLVVVFAACLVWDGAALAGDDDQAIIAATKKYVAAESSIKEVKVTVEKVEGDYARVLVTPMANETDPALVFLKREKSVWHGLTIGTGFDPEDLKKLHIPESLQP